MGQCIYPHDIRSNCLAGNYCELAMDHYYDALMLFEKIKEQKYHASTIMDCFDLQEQIIVTTVFAGMCLESFFNDYASACLGDEEFYSNFDKLDVKSKFILIAKFILNAEVDKSQSYYSHLTSLIKRRNSFVHNKSYKVEINGCSGIIHGENDDVDYDKRYLSKEEITAIKDELTYGLNALKAIRDIAYYFDEHDTNALALVRLMRPYGMFDSEIQKKQRELVLSRLDIKVND